MTQVEEINLPPGTSQVRCDLSVTVDGETGPNYYGQISLPGTLPARLDNVVIESAGKEIRKILTGEIAKTLARGL